MKATIIGQVPVEYRDPDVILRLSADTVKRLTRTSLTKEQMKVGVEIDFGPCLERVQEVERRETDLRCFGEIVAKFLPKPPEPEQPTTA